MFLWYLKMTLIVHIWNTVTSLVSDREALIDNWCSEIEMHLLFTLSMIKGREKNPKALPKHTRKFYFILEKGNFLEITILPLSIITFIFTASQYVTLDISWSLSYNTVYILEWTKLELRRNSFLLVLVIITLHLSLSSIYSKPFTAFYSCMDKAL